MRTLDGLSARFNEGARRVLSRDLTPKEVATLEDLYADEYRLAAGSSAKDREFVALTAVASTLFNLDAALTR
jgi:hypothetical protein